MAIMISIPAGVVANQNSTLGLSENYNETITNMQEQINQSLTLIQCSLTSQPTPGSSPGFFPGFMPRSMPGLNEEFMNESIVSNITSIPGVEAVVPILQKSVGTTENITRFDRTFSIFRPDYTIVGVPLNSSLIDAYPILPANITEGRNLQNGDSEVVVLSLNNTEYFGVDVGGTVNINGSDFTVVGVHGTTGFTQATTLYMNILDAQRVTDHTGEMSRLDVYATSSSEVDAVVSAINSMYPELSVTTSKDILTQLQNMQQRYTEMLNNAQSTLAQTQSTATEVIIIAVAATSLIVLFVMLYTVRERTKEIGTLKAIGFSNWNVMSQFMLEGILISLIAGAVASL
jgi:ABC-type antimicrobial peptide transport system permease subunit